MNRLPDPTSEPTMTVQPLKSDRPTLTVPEAAALLGVSRNVAYEAARSGELPAIRIGRRVLVLRARLEALLNGDEADVATRAPSTTTDSAPAGLEDDATRPTGGAGEP
jgi:excisionase family DNA binding protein